jgi:hypothetical protein
MPGIVLNCGISNIDEASGLLKEADSDILEKIATLFIEIVNCRVPGTISLVTERTIDII